MSLDLEIAAYDKVRNDLERQYIGKWIVFHDQNLVGVFDDASTAGDEAIRRFGRGPYLIRRVGAAPFVLPASLMYFSAHASS